MAGAERSELLGLEFERSRAPAIVERCLTWCDGPRVTHIILTVNASHLLSPPGPRCSRAPGGRIVDGIRKYFTGARMRFTEGELRRGSGPFVRTIVRSRGCTG